MRRALLGIGLALTPFVGCASAPPKAPPQPLRFAVIAAPMVGAPEASDALYEVVDVLSLEPELDLVLVVGPLYGAGKQPVELARDELIGALGALSGPVHIALGPLDLERDPDLLERLDRALPDRPLQLAYRDEVKGVGVRVIGPGGEEPEVEGSAERWIVLGGPPGYTAGTLRITHGPGFQLEENNLLVPALGSGEPVFVVGTLDPARGRFSARLRSGEQELEQEVGGPWN